MIIKPQRTLGEALYASVTNYPNKIAIIEGKSEYSYSVIKNTTLKLASVLMHKGMRKGDRVLLYLENSWIEAISIYAVTLAGGVFVPINPQTKADKLQYILNDSGAIICIAEGKLRHELEIACKETKALRSVFFFGNEKHTDFPCHISIEDLKELIDRGDEKTDLPGVIPNDLASLIYTSGSTGFPKGVMMTHQSMVFSIWSVIEYLRLDQNDRIMLVLPMSFDYGLYQLLMSVTLGATLIIEKSFIFLGSIYKQIEKTRPTVFPGVPTIFAMMVASYKRKPISFPFVKRITNTAAALNVEYIPYLKKIFPNALIYKMYGLTECKRVSYLEPEYLDIKPASVGKAIPGTEVFILSPEGKEILPGDTGILYVRGPHIMLGYWNQKSLSQEVLRPGKLPWERILCTNDLFKMDDDGFLYFVGRNDDIIKSRGEKVSPLEVENILLKLDTIQEAAVIGVPDEVMGQIIVAYVVPTQGQSLSAREIQHFCATHLEPFMIPQKVIISETLPKNQNGKIDKIKLFIQHNEK